MLKEKTVMSTPRGRGNELASRQIDLLSIAQGFLPSSVLFALLRLRIFELISDTEKSVDDLSVETGARPGYLGRLLNAGVMLGVLETTDGVAYRIPTDYQQLLIAADKPGYLGHWLRFMESWYEPFATLDEAVLQGGRTNMYTLDQSTIRQNTLAMHNFASVRGKELTDFLDTSACKTMLDVGCGPGTYSFELGIRNPDLSLHLLDLPAVLEVAREVQQQYDLKNPVQYIPRDLSTEEIPGTYDLVLISNALQAFDGEQIQDLLRQLYRSVAPGGSLVIQAQFLNDDRLGPRWPILVDLGCLCFTADGRNHSFGEARHWLEAIGFSDISENRMSVLNANSFLRGYKR